MLITSHNPHVLKDELGYIFIEHGFEQVQTDPATSPKLSFWRRVWLILNTDIFELYRQIRGN